MYHAHDDSCALLGFRLAADNESGSLVLTKANSIWWLVESQKCSLMDDQIILALGSLCDYAQSSTGVTSSTEGESTAYLATVIEFSGSSDCIRSILYGPPINVCCANFIFV